MVVFITISIKILMNKNTVLLEHIFHFKKLSMSSLIDIQYISLNS